MSKRFSQKQAAARVVREQLAREHRRRTQLWTSVGAAILVIVAGAGGWLLYNSQRGDAYQTPPGTYTKDVGFAVGNGPKLVEIYVDYQCPLCRNFENQTRDTLDQQLAAGNVKVVYYPVAILNRYSKNNYSTRAAAAAGCAAESGKFPEYHYALFANQPAENTAGPTDTQLIKTGKTVGLGTKFEQCVKDGKYTSWTQHTSDNFEERKLTGTPSLFVDGKQMDASMANLMTALAKSDTK